MKYIKFGAVVVGLVLLVNFIGWAMLALVAWFVIGWALNYALARTTPGSAWHSVWHAVVRLPGACRWCAPKDVEEKVTEDA